jgi:mono/diheme cytochrome c family protein
MTMRFAVLFSALLCVGVAFRAEGQSEMDIGQLPANYVPSGKAMYKDYCAACHGLDAKGNGPMAHMLKLPPADLTTLSSRHGGKFPYEYVSGVLRFGTGATILHGAKDMPVWGPIFESLDKNNERVAEKRIKNLCDYLSSLQVR